MFTKKRLFFVFLSTFVISLLFTLKIEKVFAQSCACDYEFCREDLSDCPNPPSSANYYIYQRVWYSVKGSCTDSSMCLDGYSGGSIRCGNCRNGYGSLPASGSSRICVDSCVGSPGGASCDRAGRVNYSCNPANTDSLIFQAWQDNNEYNSTNPTNTRANSIKYVSNMTFRGVPGAFCPHWYTEQFTGYIWLDGEKELRIITDDNYAVSGQPGSGQCCSGSASRCGRCQKRGSWSFGCSRKFSQSSCFRGWGCQWVVWNKSRCSDDYSNNTGVKIGFAYDSAKGKNVPVGEITDAGVPSGLTSIFRSTWGTRLRDQRFSGNSREFEPGWYPIQGWYTKSNTDTRGYHTIRPGGIKIPNISYPREGNDYEYFTLQWRDTTSSVPFSTVPSSAFTPCISSVVCGSAPEVATTPISPADGEQDVVLPVTLTWSAPADWGATCGVQTNTYTVYASVKPLAGDCLDPGPASYSALPACTDLPDSVTSCTDPFFNIRNTEFCWYVETNNGEFTTPSASNGSEVWWFETEDPLTYQEWMTTLYGDIYAGSILMEIPDIINYVAPWSPPHISYQDAAGPQVSSLASSDIDIKTDNPKAGTLYFPESESQFFVKYAAFSPNQTWPANYNGDPPADVVLLPRSGESCDDIFIHNASGNSPSLRPDEVYAADVTCVQDGLDNYGGDYRNQNPGVVVLYVTGNGDLTFNSDFLTNNDNYRVLFVSGSNIDVKIARSLDSGNPTLASTPLIEAAFVVNKSIEFVGVAPGDEETDPDTSVVVEGPIIARSVLLNRNRGLTNNYPSEVIKYNGDYLYELTSQERDSDDVNYSGLFIIDVDWVSEE